MTRQDTRRNIDRGFGGRLCAHAHYRHLGTVMAAPLALALLVWPAHALADGPAPSRQAAAEVTAGAGEVAPEVGQDEGPQSDVALGTDGDVATSQDGESPEQAPGQEGPAIPEDTAGEATPEASQPQAQASADEASATSEESTSGETTGAEGATREEAPHAPEATSTVATGPAATLALWSTLHPVGTCLMAGAVALLVVAAIRARAGQQAHQETAVASYRRRYHYIL